MNVLIAVAILELVCLMPHFAKMEVNPANRAEAKANTTHMESSPDQGISYNYRSKCQSYEYSFETSRLSFPQKIHAHHIFDYTLMVENFMQKVRWTMNDMEQNRQYSIWVVVLAVLAMALSSLVMFKLEFTSAWWYIAVEIGIQLFFIVDYIARFVHAEGKWLYVRKSMFDLVALISLHPSLTFFRIPRIARLVGIASIFNNTAAGTLVRNIRKKFNAFLDTNGFVHVLYINFYSVIFGSVLVYLFEKGITFKTFGDAVWWACVTVTTVGYGDYVPKTTMGRLVAVILMVVGIGLISMLTGTIATYFTMTRKTEEQRNDIAELRQITSDMDETQLDAIVAYAKKVKAGMIQGRNGDGSEQDSQSPLS